MSLAEPVPSPASAAPADVAHSPARPPWLRFDDVGLPVPPTVAQRVIELAGDPSASVATLANIVSKEQVLASRVLAYANSAQHCPLGNVSTVRTAIVRLGTGIVRGVVMAECFASRLYDPGTYGETLTLPARAVALQLVGGESTIRSLTGDANDTRSLSAVRQSPGTAGNWCSINDSGGPTVPVGNKLLRDRHPDTESVTTARAKGSHETLADLHRTK